VWHHDTYLEVLTGTGLVALLCLPEFFGRWSPI
jgi:hypothetical protein